MRLYSSPRVLWSLLVVYWIFLTALLLTPEPWRYLSDFGTPIQELVERTLADYARHFLAFSLLATLAWTARASTNCPSAIILLASLLSYAILTEAVQGFIPDRFFQWLDILANTVGIAVGWNLPAQLARRRASRRLA